MSESTFTQADVDRIVGERLIREREKLSRELEAQRAELTKRERLLSARAEWAQKGLPAALLDVLDLTNEDALTAAEAALKGYSKPTNTEPTNGKAKPEVKPLPRFTTAGNQGDSPGGGDRLRAAFFPKKG